MEGSVEFLDLLFQATCKSIICLFVAFITNECLPVVAINPLVTNIHVLSRPYYLDEPTFVFRGTRSKFSYFIIR